MARPAEDTVDCNICVSCSNIDPAGRPLGDGAAVNIAYV